VVGPRQIQPGTVFPEHNEVNAITLPVSYTVKYKDLVSPKDDIKSYILDHLDDTGIVYCHKREDCEEISSFLICSGLSAAVYHAGLEKEIRKKVLEDWLENKHKIIVATIAFGMGIDKHDVRYVIHYTIPKTLEEFYQESGRVGRDGKPSNSILYYAWSDEKYV